MIYWLMIGVFDSGYGGLTVFRELDKKFPKYDLIYFGDNSRAPYGSRSPETIYEYTCEAVDWLFRNGCQLVILACNTASAVALRKIQQEYLSENFSEKRVLGVLIPIAEEIAQTNGKETIGILATPATVESGAYIREIKKIDPDANIVQAAAPLLVPIIESGMIYHNSTKDIIRTYLEPLKKENIKNLVLGCTHYPFIKHLIQAEMPDAKIFDSPSIIPASLENYLSRHPEIENKLTTKRQRCYITTGDPKRFSEFAKKFIGLEIYAEKLSK
ncbi:glutamate racemase [Candidatus Giovannonibacteria bacterium]|nr:glutamate racemase [Candidatus Giovannonibacteria bacterium]